jgi:hypothetical protein
MVIAICIASGASLKKEDVEYCRGKGKVYAVKECWKLAPWADVLYAADDDWWDHYDGVKEFQGERWTCNERAAQRHGINHIPYNSDLVWGTDNVIATGGNSGFQALNLAVMQGAEKVILLGYDMGFHGNKHWWTGQFKRNIRPSNYDDWIKKFNKAAPLIPVPVINCTRETALSCFERMPLHEAL